MNADLVASSRGWTWGIRKPRRLQSGSLLQWLLNPKHVECVLFGAAEQQDMYIFHCQRYRTLQDTDLGRTIICNNHVREPLWTLLFMDAMATECVVALDAVAVAPSGSRPSPHAPQTYVLDSTAKPWWPWRCALSWQAHTPRCCFQSTRMSVYSWT